MSKTAPISVRLEEDQQEFVQALAKKYRVKDADVIRWAVDGLKSYVEAHDGNLHLPIDFTKLWFEVEKIAKKQAATGKTWVELGPDDKHPSPRINETADPAGSPSQRAAQGQVKPSSPKK